MFEARSRRADIIGAFAAGLIVVFFCLLLLWHDPLVFWNDDYELSILPVFTDVARSWSEGHLPLLSPYSWVCSNLAGEFQYGTFSVFVNAAVVLIWKFPLTFPQQAAALSIMHLFVLAAGAFLLARDLKFSIALSIFVALVASLNGWIICWGASDWFGALGAFAWLPWAWWAAQRALDPQRSRWRFLWPAPFVYLLITGGFPYTVLMLALLIAWLVLRSLFETKNFMSILPLAAGVALGFGLSSPAWFAILDYVRGSARELQPSAAHWQWIVPWRALPGFIVPGWTVNWADFSTRYLPHTANELTCGLVAPSALIAGFIWRGRLLVRQLKWELLLLLLVLLLAMLPSAGVFRWSFRWLPFFHLVLAICAAEVLQSWPGLAKFAGWPAAAITFAVLLTTYLCIPPNCGVPKYQLAQNLLDPAPLDRQRLYLSLYPPPEQTYRVEKKAGPIGTVVRPGSTSMFAGVRFINGYSPILAAGVAREFGFAIHGELRPFMGEYFIQSQAGPDDDLARMGVDGIVVASEINAKPMPENEWQLAFSSAEGNVYHRRGPPLQSVRSLAAIGSRPNEQFALAQISQINDSRNRAEAYVDVPAGEHPALLCFSRPYFSGYEARIGTRKLAVDSYRGLFPVVEVPAGMHDRLTLVYRPRWLVYGGGLSILCAVIFLVGTFAAIRSVSPSAVAHQ